VAELTLASESQSVEMRFSQLWKTDPKYPGYVQEIKKETVETIESRYSMYVTARFGWVLSRALSVIRNTNNTASQDLLLNDLISHPDLRPNFLEIVKYLLTRKPSENYKSTPTLRIELERAECSASIFFFENCFIINDEKLKDFDSIGYRAVYKVEGEEEEANELEAFT